jgi:hypothetical protein
MKIDNYSLKARIYPSFIVLLPSLLLAIYYITDFKAYFHYFTAFATVGLFSYLLSQVGRNKGKIKEPELYKLWGGKPTTQILRHSNSIVDQYTKARYHAILTAKISNISIPTKEEEANNPIEADVIYESCSKYLISQTRDSIKYSLLLKENISYGFRRNLWGMKTWGIVILIICTIIHTTLATNYFASISFKPTSDVYLYCGFGIIFIFWSFIVNPNWIKIPAFSYAERLFEQLNNLNSNETSNI